MDLARAILLELEKCEFTGGWHDIQVPGYSAQEISYHVRLLNQAGYIDADNVGTMGNPQDWHPKTITWEGHEFLDSARDITRWEKAKALVAEKGAPMTLDILKAVLTQLIRHSMGLQ